MQSLPLQHVLVSRRSRILLRLEKPLLCACSTRYLPCFSYLSIEIFLRKVFLCCRGGSGGWVLSGTPPRSKSVSLGPRSHQFHPDLKIFPSPWCFPLSLSQRALWLPSKFSSFLGLLPCQLSWYPVSFFLGNPNFSFLSHARGTVTVLNLLKWDSRSFLAAPPMKVPLTLPPLSPRFPLQLQPSSTHFPFPGLVPSIPTSSARVITCYFLEGSASLCLLYSHSYWWLSLILEVSLFERRLSILV